VNAKKIPAACDDRDVEANSGNHSALNSAQAFKSQSKRYGIVDFEDDANEWGVRLAHAADEFRASRRLRPGRGRS
jgi:hypothetical protein